LSGYRLRFYHENIFLLETCFIELWIVDVLHCFKLSFTFFVAEYYRMNFSFIG